ncbi:uncharacterized protein F5Z01DRAFT_127912 [Emericellopsis atlantica]|uniref:RING-type E3 ubiquitin transferase n=1 Tax=Emericellopsis atlantica TaxID=2614577 RepID=A0A9P7ZLG1_9HYPO|nr:uncharacterized protein F5Z01DRAFT_127912 [Emericellopsis atlantica]KAG9253775.1 hypothetical protein F5Z01DRAFT_127912 [Emericellopsis atlantica]
MLFTHSASFTQPAHQSTALHSTISSSSSHHSNLTSGSPPGGSSSSSTESSSRRRLRRLSQLRYNPSHLLSRDSSSHNSHEHQYQQQQQNAVPRSAQQGASTTSRNSNRLTLVNGTQPQTTISNTASSRAQPTETNSALSIAPSDNSASTTNRTVDQDIPPVPPLPHSSSENSFVDPAASHNQSDSTPAPPPPQTSDPLLNPQPTMPRPRASTTGEMTGGAAPASTAVNAVELLPSIRLSSYLDPRSPRPSLSFSPVTRTLPTGTEVIRVGRYSERENRDMGNVHNTQPSGAPVGFKSKVVSRRHCEFWYEDGKWFIKDVKSSSGTFLNHIRLSPPSQESKAFPINDGDLVQLGIDFKGGEEPIFRCVKVRIELNRGWQNKLNTFNMAAHKRLRTMGKDAETASVGGSSHDCSICLNMIAPCQSLFVAPCSHTWHFKCVRSLLTGPHYPLFVCPNCRAGADLEADVEDAAEDWEQLQHEDAQDEAGAPPTSHATRATPPTTPPPHNDSDPMDETMAPQRESQSPEQQQGNLPHAISEPLPISNSSARQHATPSPPGNGNTEGPITPRNEVGPWVFDGGAGRARQETEDSELANSMTANLTLDGTLQEAMATR